MICTGDLLTSGWIRFNVTTDFSTCGVASHIPSPNASGEYVGSRDAGLDEKVYILADLTPAKSDKALKYMQTVPGMKVPDELIKRMEGSRTRRPRA